MSERVLIAYGSKHGSTAETAQVVGGMLREGGLEVDVSEAARVQTLEGYGGVMIGGSIYTGRWHADARNFIKRFANELNEVPVAIFGMGPKTTEPDDMAESRAALEAALKRLPTIERAQVTIFGGVINPEKLHFPFNRLPKTDARDWDAIREFAAAFAARVARALGVVA